MVYALLFRWSTPWRTRFQAFLNIVCGLYFLFMTITVTSVSFFHIVPSAYRNEYWKFFLHRLSIVYVFLNVCGNLAGSVMTTNGISSAAKRLQNKSTSNADSSKVTKRQDRSVSKKRKVPMQSNISKMGQDGDGWCSICKTVVPARCHHCTLCETCIVKRDHHCFFRGICVGQNNQKYFILFALYMGIGCLYGMLLVAKYFHLSFGVTFHGPQTFILFFLDTFLKLLANKIPNVKYLILFVMMYASLLCGLFAFGLFFWQLMLVFNGQTTYEARRGIRTFCKGSLRENFYDVFGKRWILCSTIPFYFCLSREGAKHN